VAEACNRLKGGKLPTQKLKEQLQKIAASRTGGSKTDELLGRTGAGPEGLPDSIIVTEQGVEGEVGVEEATRDAAESPQPGKSTSKVKDARSRNEAPRAAKKSKKS